MHIIDKIIMKQEDMRSGRQPVIAFLGDSVTHGCFELVEFKNGITDVKRQECAYHQKVKKIFDILYPNVPITIINAGISGDDAKRGKIRLYQDVLSYNPDLVVVCYGLNDSMSGQQGIKIYEDSLKDIFDNIHKTDAEIIFMTPNLRCESIDTLMSNNMENIAKSVMENETEGWLENYITAAKKICSEKDVPVCDVNAIWKKLKDSKVDINKLLSNKINHPIEEMHWVFAYELVKTILFS